MRSFYLVCSLVKMAWQAYITAGLATGHIEQMCILDNAGKVQAEGGLNNQQFHPCGYAGKTAKDDGSEASIAINEQADVANFIRLGKKTSDWPSFLWCEVLSFGRHS